MFDSSSVRFSVPPKPALPALLCVWKVFFASYAISRLACGLDWLASGD